MHRLEAVMLAE